MRCGAGEPGSIDEDAPGSRHSGPPSAELGAGRYAAQEAWIEEVERERGGEAQAASEAR